MLIFLYVACKEEFDHTATQVYHFIIFSMKLLFVSHATETCRWNGLQKPKHVFTSRRQIGITSPLSVCMSIRHTNLFTTTHQKLTVRFHPNFTEMISTKLSVFSSLMIFDRVLALYWFLSLSGLVFLNYKCNLNEIYRID